MILTSECVDERCDHSNETSSAVLSHDTIVHLNIYILGIVLNFDFRHS